MKNIILSFSLFILCQNINAQAVSYSDPGQAFLKLNLNNYQNSMIRIGNYKVTGTQYLFGNNVKGNFSFGLDKYSDVNLSYNTYNQTVELPNETGNGFLIKSALEVDSFTMNESTNGVIPENFNFISSKYFGEKNPVFLLEVYKGNKFTLYKSYKTDLKIVGSSIGQTDLREFDLTYEYFYLNSTAAEKKLQKFKTTRSFIKKEFGTNDSVMQAIMVEDFSATNQISLTNIFKILNQ